MGGSGTFAVDLMMVFRLLRRRKVLLDPTTVWWYEFLQLCTSLSHDFLGMLILGEGQKSSPKEGLGLGH